MDVSNPGALRISKSVAVSGGTSDARNAKIFNIFSLVKIGERSGMGLSQLFGNWELAGYAKPILTETFSPERTRVSVSLVAEKVTERRADVTEKITEALSDVTEKKDAVLNDTEERIVALIRSNAHITQKMLSEAIGLTRPHIGRKLLELQARKVIRRVGPDRGGIWELL